MHTTARCVAALELFDVGPTHPISALQPYATAEAIRGFLDGLNWQGEPLAESVRATALYTILKLTGAPDAAWEDAYFEWLWENSDPATGLWRRGQLAGAVGDGTFPRLAAAFYFLSTHEYARRRLRYPTPLLRTALAYWRESGEWLVEQIGFDALAWVYCVTRAGRQATDPYFEGRWELARFLESHVRFLMGLDHERHEQWNDLHALSGTVSCLAELQQALPGTVRTEKPLRQVLDRRPF